VLDAGNVAGLIDALAVLRAAHADATGPVDPVPDWIFAAVERAIAGWVRHSPRGRKWARGWLADRRDLDRAALVEELRTHRAGRGLPQGFADDAIFELVAQNLAAVDGEHVTGHTIRAAYRRVRAKLGTEEGAAEWGDHLTERDDLPAEYSGLDIDPGMVEGWLGRSG
jgi:hypothetical protein